MQEMDVRSVHAMPSRERTERLVSQNGGGNCRLGTNFSPGLSWILRRCTPLAFRFWVFSENTDRSGGEGSKLRPSSVSQPNPEHFPQCNAKGSPNGYHLQKHLLLVDHWTTFWGSMLLYVEYPGRILNSPTSTLIHIPRVGRVLRV